MDTTRDKAKSLLAVRIVAFSTGVPMSLCFTIIQPILPKMEAALAHGPNDAMLVKMTMGVHGLAMVLGAPLAGLLADRISRTVLLVWAMLLWAAFGFSGYFIDDLRLMLAARFLVGIMTVTVMTVSLAMIGDIAEEGPRNRLMGFNSAAMAVVGIVSMPIAGMMGDIHWRLPFYLYFITVPLAAIAYWGLKTHPVPTPIAATTTDIPTKEEPFSWPWGTMFLAFLTGVVILTTAAYIPFAFRDLGVTSSAQIGTSIASMTVVSAIMAALFGYARAYISSNAALIFSFGMAACGMAAIAMSTSPQMVVIALAFFGLGTGWFSPNVALRGAELASTATRGRVLGLVKGAQLAASFIAVLLLEPIYRFSGAKGVFGIVAGISLVTMLFYVFRSRMPGLPQAVKPTAPN